MGKLHTIVTGSLLALAPANSVQETEFCATSDPTISYLMILQVTLPYLCQTYLYDKNFLEVRVKFSHQGM
jgi:hypothetical protein